MKKDSEYVFHTPSVLKKYLVSKGSYAEIFNWVTKNRYLGWLLFTALFFGGLVEFAADVSTVLNSFPSLNPVLKSNIDESNCTNFALAKWNEKYRGLTDADAKRTFMDQDQGRRVCGIFIVTNVITHNSKLFVSLMDPMDSDVKAFPEVEFKENRGSSLKIEDTISISGDLVGVQKFISENNPRDLFTRFSVMGSHFERIIGGLPKA